MFANNDNEKIIKTYASLLQDIREAKINEENGEMPSRAQIMKLCKDGKTKEEICDMYPDCDQKELKDMIDSCMDELAKK